MSSQIRNSTTPHTLVFPQSTWRQSVPPLLLDGGQVAMGECVENSHSLAHEFIVRRLARHRAEHWAHAFAEFRQPVVIVVPPEPGLDDFEIWRQRIGELTNRPAVLVQLGLGRDRDQWRGLVNRNGVTLPMRGLRVVGSGMPSFGATSRIEPPVDSPSELRWSRLRGVLGDAHQIIRRSRVLIVGAGRIGSIAAMSGALLGCSALTIADPDRLKVENLDAAWGLLEEDIGLNKAEALANRLHRMRSDLTVSHIPRAANHPSIEQAARSADLLITCVDNDAPRLVVALLANRWAKVHLDLATGITHVNGERQLAGDARLLVPGEGCVACVGGLPQRADAELELISPPGALRRGQPVAWNQQRIGSLLTLNNLTVSTGMQLWLDLLTGTGETSRWHRLRWEEGSGLEVHFANVGAARSCNICSVII